ncbi:hypothetical protein B0T10DRAFT_106391 [Thelonectria olida]|uniref:Uncharacterized protein n=1 Tax=Thelonectria olida TaxID=1576542 RepID=A0A9P8WI17_9HYPO|nr:hypothetical protein B0T10DRAFT_106391 [Thelonectria olida]
MNVQLEMSSWFNRSFCFLSFFFIILSFAFNFGVHLGGLCFLLFSSNDTGFELFYLLWMLYHHLFSHSLRGMRRQRYTTLVVCTFFLFQLR